MKECHEIITGEKDAELMEIAKQEAEDIMESIEEQSEEIIEAILPKSEADGRNCTIEVMSAAGGSESSLFCEELFNMYKAYCRLMGFRCEQIELMQDMSINKGVKKGLLKVTGTDVYKHLKHECGVHKV